MAVIPTSTRSSLAQRLSARVRERWPQLTSQWGFAIYRASEDDYHQTFLPGDELTARTTSTN